MSHQVCRTYPRYGPNPQTTGTAFGVKYNYPAGDNLDLKLRTDDMEVAQMLAFRKTVPPRHDAEGRDRIILRIRSDQKTPQNLGAISAIVNTQTPIWENGAWNERFLRKTANPAALYRAYALGTFVPAKAELIVDFDPVPPGNWGIALPHSRIDHAALGRWYDYCEQNKLECNITFRRRTSHFQVLNTIARAGEASPTWQTGKLGVVFAQQNDPVSALFTAASIIAGSFRITYATSRAPKQIVATYLDAAEDWRTKTLRVNTNAPAAAGEARVTLDGITNAPQAQRAAQLLANRQRLLRRQISFRIGLESLRVQRGDVVQIGSDLLGDHIASGRLHPIPEDAAAVHSFQSIPGNPSGGYRFDSFALRLFSDAAARAIPDFSVQRLGGNSYLESQTDAQYDGTLRITIRTADGTIIGGSSALNIHGGADVSLGTGNPPGFSVWGFLPSAEPFRSNSGLNIDQYFGIISKSDNTANGFFTHSTIDIAAINAAVARGEPYHWQIYSLAAPQKFRIIQITPSSPTTATLTLVDELSGIYTV